MKKRILAIICLCSFLFGGCFNYKDIDKVIFATAVIIDIDENKNTLLYVEGFRAKKEQSDSIQGQRLILKGKGKTVFEAVRNLASITSFKVNYGQNKVLMFTERTLKYGLDNFTDFFDRDEETLLKPYIVMLNGEPEKILTCELKSEQYIGTFIDQLVKNIKTSSRVTLSSFNEYLNKKNFINNCNIIPIIGLSKEKVGAGDSLQIMGDAVIKDEKLVAGIELNEGQGYNFLMNNIKSGSLEVTNPKEKDKFVSLEIRNSKTNTKLKKEGDKIILDKYIDVSVILSEIQKELVVDDKTLLELKSYAEKNIKMYSISIFNKFKEKGIDIFNIGEDVYRKYGINMGDNSIKNAQLKLSVNVNINAFGQKKSFPNISK